MAKPQEKRNPPAVTNWSPGKWTPVLLAAVLLLGFALRVCGIGQRGYYNMDFIAYHAEAVCLDEFYHWHAQQGTGTGQSFPAYLAGQAGCLPPSHAKPLHVELQRLAFRLFGRNPSAMSWAGAIIGTLNILLLWQLARKLFRNETLALASALFLAVSGYNVLYAGRGYNHSIVTFFGLLTALSLASIYEQESGKSALASFLTGVFAGLALASHYNVIASLPVVLLAAFLAGRSWGWRGINAVAAGAGLALPVLGFNAYYRWMAGFYPALESFLVQMWRQSGTAGGSMLDLPHSLQYVLVNITLDGWVLTTCLFTGIVLGIRQVIRAIKKKEFRSIGPFAYVLGVVVWSLVIWGAYNYKVPRTQSFVMFGFPLLAAYALSRVWDTLRSRKSAERWARLLILTVGAAAVVEGGYQCSRMFYLGRGHKQAVEWVLAASRQPAGNVSFPLDREEYRWQYPPEGKFHLWFVDLPELASTQRRDCIIIDYPSLFHNFIYTQATHPGSVQFAQFLFGYLDQYCPPLLDAEYVEPIICQLDNGRLWHLPFSASQPLSHHVRVYDMKDVLKGYSFAVEQLNQLRQRQSQGLAPPR